MNMNKIIYPVLFALTLSACGKGQKAESADSDSIAESAVMEAVEAVRQSMYITKDSIGAIAIGTAVNTLPDSVPGLYTSKENGASPDAVTVVFSDDNGQEFIAYDFGEGNVDVINVIGTGVYVDAPRGAFNLESPFSKVLELPGVETEWMSYDDNGMWYWRWNGLWFAPSQDNLPRDLSMRLYNSEQAPTPKDFTDEVKVGFIGTGLPF